MAAYAKKYLAQFKSTFTYLNRVNPNIAVFILYGLLYDTVVNIYKPFAVKFLERIGGGAFYISLFNALPGLLAAVSLLPASVFIARFHKKKRVTSLFFLFSRTVLLSLAFVPAIPAGWRPLVFVLLFSLMNFPEAVSQTALQGLLGNLFEGRVRAQAIALRSKFGNILVLLVTLVTGLVITLIPKTDAQRILCYQVFFVLAFLVGLIEITVFNRFTEPDPEPDASISVAKPDFTAIGAIFQDKRFLGFFTVSMIFTFSWQTGWPLSSIYMIQTLGATEIWLAVFAVIMGISSFCFAGFWNKLIYKVGADKALWISIIVMAGNMIVYPLAPNLWFLCLVSVYNGFAVVGITITQLNGILGATPEKNRLLYLGVYNTFTNVSLFLAPFLSYFLIRTTGIIASFLIVGGMRLCAAACMYLYIRRKKEEAQ